MDVGLVILDGWGLNPAATPRDAVRAADTPTFDRLQAAGADGTLRTHGHHVGLPAGQMGNSEVGHLTIGAGRVVYQESARITDAIRRYRGKSRAAESPADPEDPPIDANSAIDRALRAAGTDGTLHLLGLVSDGGVHAYQTHLEALIDIAAERSVSAVTHAFTDGRDTEPRSGVTYLAGLETHAAATGTGQVASVTGRYYAMDRDENWTRTRRAYDAIVDASAPHQADSAVGALEASYDRGDTDEFVEPTLVAGGHPVAAGDAAIFVNFRADRARQLTRMLAGAEPDWDGGADPAWPAGPPSNLELVTMTEYDETLDLPVAFPPRQPDDTLGEVLAETGQRQLRIAETEKYAHVTYFLNGGRELEFPGEHREIVASPDVRTYDQQPEMSAPEVTDRAIGVIERSDPDAVVMNYANPDMVGHTGDFEAAVAAVEAVDAQLDRLVPVMRRAGAHVLLTADHGNADDMGSPAEPHTAHTTNPVPFVAVAPPVDGEDGTVAADGDVTGGYAVREDGGLADVAPTILALLGIERPPAMTGRSLLAGPDS
jgi:2,3-bisphosphoglycerate-independent phosphoglycerate mutase